MSYTRKTVDCWRFYVNYAGSWEHEITEFTREEMRENRTAYRENCNYPLKIVKGREKVTNLELGQLEEILAKLESFKQTRLTKIMAKKAA